MAEQNNQPVAYLTTTAIPDIDWVALNRTTNRYWNNTGTAGQALPLPPPQARIEELATFPTIRVPTEVTDSDMEPGVSIRRNAWADNINIVTRFTEEELCQLKRKIMTEIARRVAKDFIASEEPTLQAIKAEFLAKLQGDQT